MFEKLGFQLYTVRDQMTDVETADKALRALADIGYSEVHIFSRSILDSNTVVELCKKNGIDVVGVHYDVQQTLFEPEATMEVHAKWGTNRVGIGAMPKEYRENLDTLKDFINKVNTAAEIYAKNGFQLSYHNHNFEFLRMDGNKTMMDILYEGFDPATTYFVLDTGWVAAGGADPVDWMEKLAGRIEILHLKDFFLCKKDNYLVHDITEIGNGTLAWGRIIDAAERIGVKSYVVEQDINFTESSVNSLKISADYLARYIKR